MFSAVKAEVFNALESVWMVGRFARIIEECERLMERGRKRSLFGRALGGLVCSVCVPVGRGNAARRVVCTK